MPLLYFTFYKAMKLLLFLGSIANLLLAQQPVRYQLQFPNAAHHEAEVQVRFTGVKPAVLEVMMSRSSPGRYALHEFAKNIYNFRATDGNGRSLPVSRPSPYQWNVSGHNGTVVVDYTLYGDRVDGTYSAIDTTHAHLNGPATLMWAHGFENTPVALQFTFPEGSKWKIATQLAPQPDGTWTAPNVDRLMDAPIEVGTFTLKEWKTGDTQFRMAIHHKGTEQESEAFAKLGAAVTAEAEGVFGNFPKFDSGAYTFLIDYLPYANGDGMEHRNSTVISGSSNLKESSTQLIGTVSHELIHAWNVKRIRPKSLEPFDFQNANMSGELWFAEGFTSYYGNLILMRAGLINVDRFAGSVGYPVSAVLTNPGRQVFNVIDMSRRAPFVDAASANDPVNTANTFISYYTYGGALALGIDLAIRAQFPGKSLDDWMRQMWREHPDSNKPYTLTDLQNTLATITNKEFAATIFKNHIEGMEPMDYEKLLAHGGMLLRKTAYPKVWIDSQELVVSADRGSEISAATLRGSPLFKAGLDRGDRILSWDGRSPKTAQELTALLDSYKPGDHIKLVVETRDGKKDIDLELSGPQGYELLAYEAGGLELTAEMKAFRKSWLESKAVHPLPKMVKYCPTCKRAHPFEFENCPFDGASLQVLPSDTNGPPRSFRRGRRPR